MASARRETAHHVLDYVGGTLIMPMTVLIEEYWREISRGLAKHAIPYDTSSCMPTHRHSARAHREGRGGPVPFRFAHLEPYAEAARTWLPREGECVDTTHLTAAQAAQRIAAAASS